MKNERTRKAWLVTVLVGILLHPVGFGCMKHDGKTAEDKKVAAAICKVFEGNEGIPMMSVHESILYVDITRAFFAAMQQDKIKAHGLIALWMKGLRQETGRHAVTVWVYVEKVKVAEGETSWLGEDVINTNILDG